MPIVTEILLTPADLGNLPAADNTNTVARYLDANLRPGRLAGVIYDQNRQRTASHYKFVGVGDLPIPTNARTLARVKEVLKLLPMQPRDAQQIVPDALGPNWQAGLNEF